jgi:TolA-binding protein
LFKADKLKEAAAAFDEVLKKDPPAGMAAEAKFVRGRILERLGQDELALALFENVIAKYPNDTRYPEALFSAARLYDEKKEYGQAAEAYQKLVEKYPQFAERDAAVYRWAWTMHALKKPDEAHRLLDRLRKDFSQSRFAADASYRLAEDAIDAKEYDRAARLLDDVVNAKTGSGPVDPEILQIRDFAMFLRGRIAEERSDWTNMRKAYEDFLKAFPNSPRRQLAEFWIAESYYRQGDYATASKRLGELSDEIKEHRKPWMGMIPLRQAQILAKQKQWKDAYAIAAKIECAFPEFAQQYEVDYLLGRCLADQADFDGARKAYERVIHSTAGAKTETAAMAQWMIGETYFHQKNFEAAYREYLKVEILYAYPACQAIGLLQAGKCRERVGDSQEAVSLYQRLVKNYANTPYVPEAAERLKVLAAAQR